MAAHDTVQVALRVRPLNSSERDKGCKVCLDVHKPENQIVIKAGNQAFTFNYVFPEDADQNDVYEVAVKDLLKQLFKGYNVTILAYGQTGSGKTFTMGTNYGEGNDVPKGIIPYAVEDIFKQVNNDTEWEYTVTASFIELYQEQLYDLLSERPRESSIVDIREDKRGIYIPNLTEKTITTTAETFEYLQQGSQCRATGATAMNAQSSRSHAIFTISLNLNKKDNAEDAMTAKFHLVDLAGSERSKKTQAAGERFKEGVNINKGLLALGNVVSALGEGHGFISYRDSKLTRLLQDSLGGNSQTLMIACVSPADYNQNETLSTLRYADRARRIKNRPIINQDPKLAEIMKLRKEVEMLKYELMSSQRNAEREVLPIAAGDSGANNIPIACPPEHTVLSNENFELKIKLKKVTDLLGAALIENNHLCEQILMGERSMEHVQSKLTELDHEYSRTIDTWDNSKDPVMVAPLKELQSKIKELQAEQKKSEEEILNHVIYAPATTSSDDATKSPDTPKHEVEMRETHIFQQAELSKEIQALTKNMAYKEELVKKLAASSDFMTNTGNDSESQIRDLQGQITLLQAERNDLTEYLKNIQNNPAGNKLAEQRRKRLQELEQKITNLNKKITEQARVIKMKEKSDEKIVNLNREILSMKQMKVKLIQQMKSESEKFRVMKQSRERELCKLREQDRRRQNQMVRMELLHSKQQNVLKRKVEEATAVNKRLKDALSLKQAAQERSGSKAEQKATGWVDQELEVMVSTAIAERTLDQLFKDRAHLKELQMKLKRTLSEDDISKEDQSRYQQEIDMIAQDIELRSTQIADMQQKIMDSNQESKMNSHVDQLHSLLEAKNTLKYLFSVATDAKKDASHKQYELSDLKDACDEYKENLRKLEAQLLEAKAAHETELNKNEKENQEKVYLLLRQLHGKDKTSSSESNSHLIQRINILNEQLEKMDVLRKENEELQQEIEMLRTHHKRNKRTKNGGSSSTVIFKDIKDEEDVTPDEDEDMENDPDWRNTPIYKRLKTIKERELNVAVKRGNDGVPKCGCKTDCSKKACSCKKSGSNCSLRCKCNAKCKNTFEVSNGNSTASDGENSDESFKKPRRLKSRVPVQFTFDEGMTLEAGEVKHNDGSDLVTVPGLTPVRLMQSSTPLSCSTPFGNTFYISSSSFVLPLQPLNFQESTLNRSSSSDCVEGTPPKTRSIFDKRNDNSSKRRKLKVESVISFDTAFHEELNTDGNGGDALS